VILDEPEIHFKLDIDPALPHVHAHSMVGKVVSYLLYTLFTSFSNFELTCNAKYFDYYSRL